MEIRHVGHSLVSTVEELAEGKVTLKRHSTGQIMLKFVKGDRKLIASYSLHLCGSGAAQDISHAGNAEIRALARRDDKFSHSNAAPKRLLQQNVSVASDIRTVGAVLHAMIASERRTRLHLPQKSGLHISV